MTGAARITIVGGGFSGTSAAIQLVRTTTVPLAITIVEPRAEVGPGLAYSSSDPDHRLNAPTASHSVDPVDAGHFTRWCEAQSIFQHDPQALLTSGIAFVRRSDFGEYLAASLREHAVWPATGSTIVHVRERATGATACGGAIMTSTESGQVLKSAMLIVATGNPSPRLPALFDRSLLEHPSIVANPLQKAGLRHIDPQASVLVVGSGLTALDVVSTLVRSGHDGGIVVVSRRGLRPRPHSPALEAPAAAASTAGATERPLDRILGPVPAFLSAAEETPTTVGWLRRIRMRIRELELNGKSWHVAFDELRDVVWRVWPLLPVEQKRRFLRMLRPWYDVHRFRAPPQNDALVRMAESQGRVEFRAARLRAIDPVPGRGTLKVRFSRAGDAHDRVECFSAIVNCTGLDAAAGVQESPFLSALMTQGWLRVDDTGIGFAVDPQCRAIDTHGHAQPALRVIGPLTAGTFGDPLGVVYITAQIYRMLPDVLNTLSGTRLNWKTTTSKHQ